MDWPRTSLRRRIRWRRTAPRSSAQLLTAIRSRRRCVSVGAVARAQLRDRFRDPVANRAFGQTQGAGYLECRRATDGRDQHLSLASAERALAQPDRIGGQARVDHRLAGHTAPDGVGQILRRRVLGHEAGGTGVHRPAQESGPSKSRHHEHAAGRQLPVEIGGDAEAVLARKLDVKQHHLGVAAPDGRDHLIAPPHLGHHLHVTLELEEPPNRGPEHRLVFSQEDSDHRGTRSSARSSARLSAGTVTRTWKPPPDGASQATLPPRRWARSCNPWRPHPETTCPPRPSSRISAQASVSSRPRVTTHRDAPLWRSTLVTASRTHRARTCSASSTSGFAPPTTSNAMPAASSAAFAPAI